MCGIAGVVQLDGNPVDVSKLNRMTDILAHRGPDDRGVWIKDKVGIGHRRLSILDISSDGKQPFVDSQNTAVLTYNGELYNFKELRSTLQSKGYVFTSQSDTEVVLLSYKEWGKDCVQKFRGMFAFAIWDQREQFLWLVRDRIGIKPLFYSAKPNVFMFGSEIKSILEYDSVGPRLHIEGLAYYLGLNYVPGAHTLFSDIQQLMPGHQLELSSSGKIQISKYWDFSYEETTDLGEKHYVERFDELMRQTVSQHLVSDVPHGLLLSGGLDSSSLAYYMSQVEEMEVESFSIDFQEDSYGESKYASKVAKHLSCNHHSTMVESNAIELLPKLVWHSEEPTADSSMLAYYHLCESARKKITVAIGGDGADEILAGYETYSAWKAHQMYRCLPSWLTSTVLKPMLNQFSVSDKKMSKRFKLRRFLNTSEMTSEEAHASWRVIFDEEARSKLLQPLSQHDGIHSDFRTLFIDSFNNSPATDPVNRMLYVDSKVYLPSDMLTKVDRMSMAHSLEVRVPFLDHELVDFVNTVPSKYKLKYWLKKKHLLKQAMRGRLTNDIIYRKKAGFNLPVNQWLRSGMKEFVCDHLSESTIKTMGIFDSDYVASLLQNHFDKKSDNSFEIWGLLVCSIWFSTFNPRV